MIMRKKKKKLSDVLDLETGLFIHLDNAFWKDRYHLDDMDLEFLTSHTERPITRLVEKLLVDGKLDAKGAKRLINLIYRKHEEQWKRAYEVLDAQYKIIDNYNMIEEEDVDREHLENVVNELSATTLNNSETLNELKQLIKEERDFKQESNEEHDNLNTAKDNSSTTVDESGTESSSTNGSSKLTFDGRSDKETRDVTDEQTLNLTDLTEGTDTLSFIDRKDSTVGKGTDTGSGTNNNDQTVTDTQIKNRVENEKSYGINSTFGSLVGSTDSTESIMGGDLKTSDNGTTSHNNTTSSEDTLTKTGSEKNTNKNEVKKTGTDVTKGTGSVENTKQGSEITTDDSETTGTTENNSTTTNEGTVETTDTGNASSSTTDTGTGSSDSETSGSVNVKDSGESTEESSTDSKGSSNEKRVLTRSGNIGVTTTTDLLQQHLDFWKWSFVESVYGDVAKMLMLDIYVDKDNEYVLFY